MQKLLLVVLTCCFLATAQAQLNGPAGSGYNQAIGVKFPGGLSLTYKKFVTDTHSIEGLLTSFNNGFRVAGMYEFNFYSFSSVDGLAWFVGPGAHIGFWRDSTGKHYSSRADLGLDGIIGLDYKFKDIPIAVSIDWQPSLTLMGTASPHPAYGGLAVRYTF